MTAPPPPLPGDACATACSPSASIESLNRSCYCLSLDPVALRRELQAGPEVGDIFAALGDTHPHLFAGVPLFIARPHIDQMARVVRALESVVTTPPFQQAALSWAPDIARHDPGSPGGVLGIDFHLTPTGPRVIEINTNPGGALLNAALARAHRACCPDAVGLAVAPREPDAIENALFDSFLAEWRAQRPEALLCSVAIVDSRPLEQYLYPEFLLYAHLFRQHGLDAVICDPGELALHGDELRHGDRRIDLVYNRLTDFSLDHSAHDALRRAYLAGAVVLTPHPRAHALYADKRNLTLLGDEAFLRDTGLEDAPRAALLAAIPPSEIVTAENRDALWAKRRQFFFKPAGGYGSKATYRGDKLTTRVWDEMAGSAYIAQALVVPSERHVAKTQTPLKTDVRVYAYRGTVLLVVARLYQGQTTNFRTPGGGFAPVFTEA